MTTMTPPWTPNPSTWEHYLALGPAIIGPDPTTGWVLLGWIDGPGHLRDEVASIVRWRGGRAGWQDLLDADRCPAWALPWLAQWVGVDIDPIWSTSQIREAIRTPLSWRRATPGVIADAASLWVTYGRVSVIERLGGDEHTIGIQVWESQVGVISNSQAAATVDGTNLQASEEWRRNGDVTAQLARLERAIEAAIPAWIVAELEVLPDPGDGFPYTLPFALA